MLRFMRVEGACVYEESHPRKSVNRIVILCASSCEIPTLAGILYFRIFYQCNKSFWPPVPYPQHLIFILFLYFK